MAFFVTATRERDWQEGRCSHAATGGGGRIYGVEGQIIHPV
jgi:hypothetical protein